MTPSHLQSIYCHSNIRLASTVINVFLQCFHIHTDNFHTIPLLRLSVECLCIVVIHDCRVKRLYLVPNVSWMASPLSNVVYKNLTFIHIAHEQ